MRRDAEGDLVRELVDVLCGLDREERVTFWYEDGHLVVQAVRGARVCEQRVSVRLVKQARDADGALVFAVDSAFKKVLV